MARLLKSSNRFTAYIFYPIELKLGRMILDVRPNHRSKPDFSISFQGGCPEGLPIIKSLLNRSIR